MRNIIIVCCLKTSNKSIVISIFSLFIILMSFTSIAQVSADSSKVYLEFKVSSYEAYIMNSKYFNDYLLRYDSVSGFWNPTKFDIKLCESGVKSYLLKRFKEKNLIFYTYAFEEYDKDYKRQYFGYFNGSGERCIHIIFAHVTDESLYKWRIRRFPYHIYDAGQSFFKLTYNVDNDIFYNLKISD